MKSFLWCLIVNIAMGFSVGGQTNIIGAENLIEEKKDGTIRITITEVSPDSIRYKTIFLIRQSDGLYYMENFVNEKTNFIMGRSPYILLQAQFDGLQTDSITSIANQTKPYQIQFIDNRLTISQVNQQKLDDIYEICQRILQNILQGRQINQASLSQVTSY